MPVLANADCEAKLRRTRLGYDFKLHPGFVCAGGEEGKDACKVRTFSYFCVSVCFPLDAIVSDRLS